MKDQHVTYDSIAVGDRIPSFETFETQETIDNTRMPEITARPPRPNIHTDPEFARRGLFAGTVNGGVITMAYVTTMLERWFPAASFYDGGRLEFKAIQPFRPGDTVVFTGTVTGKSVASTAMALSTAKSRAQTSSAKSWDSPQPRCPCRFSLRAFSGLRANRCEGKEWAPKAIAGKCAVWSRSSTPAMYLTWTLWCHPTTSTTRASVAKRYSGPMGSPTW